MGVVIASMCSWKTHMENDIRIKARRAGKRSDGRNLWILLVLLHPRKRQGVSLWGLTVNGNYGAEALQEVQIKTS